MVDLSKSFSIHLAFISFQRDLHLQLFQHIVLFGFRLCGVWKSWLPLQALYAVILVTRLHLWVFIPGAILFATITGGSAAGVICCIIPICYILITDHLHQIDSLCVSFSEEAFRWCADGGLLAVVSIFVIIHSHIQVNQIEDTARDLRKTYRAILELPLKPTNPDGETCCEWMERRVTNLCVDFLSSARLLIAWSEDIPQGVIGVALVLRYAGPNGIGFAGISAIISISKGILIPGLQRAVLSHRTAAVQRGLDAIVREEKKRAMIEKRFQGTTPVGDSRVRFLVEGLLREESSDLLKRLNVGESDLFQAIRNRRESWLQESCEEIRNLVVADYLKQGVSAKDLFDLGHMTGNCKESGFSARECKDIAGFSVQQCRVAGFTPADCLEAGFSTNDCKDEGFSAAECKEAGFSPKQCKGAGFSAKECKEADFSAKEFKDAGFPAIQCRVVGFEVKVCQEAGYPTEELSREPTAQDYKDAGFSAEECRNEGFSATACKTAGFSLKEIIKAGFSPEQARDAGFSANQFREAGAVRACKDARFSAKECKEAGFSLNDIAKAGFSPEQARDAGFSAGQFKEAEQVGSLKDARFSAQELKEAGFSVQELYDLRFSEKQLIDAGFSASQFKEAGADAKWLRDRGLSIKDCKGAGFSAKECKDANFSVKELKDAGFPAIQCKIVGFEVRMCQEAGYSTEELSREPTAQDYKDAGLSAKECKEVANFSAKACKELGFSLSLRSEMLASLMRS